MGTKIIEIIVSNNTVVVFIPMKNTELVISDSEISGYSDGRLYYEPDNEKKEQNYKLEELADNMYFNEEFIKNMRI